MYYVSTQIKTCVHTCIKIAGKGVQKSLCIPERNVGNSPSLAATSLSLKKDYIICTIFTEIIILYLLIKDCQTKNFLVCSYNDAKINKLKSHCSFTIPDL